MKLNFTRGINNATKPIHTPEGSYSDAENMRIDGGSKRTEEGMKKTGVPSNFIQWGSCSIGDESILLGSINSKSIIGSLSTTDTWVEEIGPRTIDILGITEPTQVVGKKNWAGERVIYFSTPSGSRRINLDITLPTDNGDFDKVTSLFLEYDLPRTTCTGEVNSGNLPSGSYEFATRLVTASGATTSFGPISGVYPVVPISLQSNRQAVVGAPPQTATTKAITLNLTNIDNTFKYVEIGVLTYVGNANTPTLTVTNRVGINNQTTINYTYRGTQDDAGTLSIDEFIISGVAYTTAKLATQKDGTLILGSPEEAEQPAVDWYRVAAGIVAKFVVKLIPYAEALTFETSRYTNKDNYALVETSSNPMDNGYKNPLTCAIYKGYRRKEVYSFTITPVFTSGVYGPTIHIPAPAGPNEPANSTGDPNDGGTLGTYVSEEKYPENDMYPGITTTDGLRLHKFPDVDIQPIIQGDVTTGNLNIRVLGVKFENIVLDPSEADQAPLIAGYVIGRVNRTGNETQLAQGIVRPHCDVIYSGNVWGQSTMLGDGFGVWRNEPQNKTADYQGKIEATSIKLNTFNFIAPDIIHRLYQIEQGTHIKQHSVYKADPYVVPAIDVGQDDPQEDGYGIARPFFKNVIGVSAYTLTTGDKELIELDGNRKSIQPFGVPLAPKSKGGKVTFGFVKGSDSIKMCSSDGLWWLSTLNNIPIKYHNITTPLYSSRQRVDGNENQSIQRLDYLLPAGTKVDFIVHSIESPNVKQYGALYQMTSMFVDYIDTKSLLNNSNSLQFFNGDTFINKYGLSLNDEGPFPWPTPDDGGSPNHIGNMRPATLNGIVYFWLESSNNYAYRHFYETESFTENNITAANGSTPFFPAYKQLANQKVPFGILSMHAENWSRPGYASQYNNQYSTQSTLKPYVITPKEDVDKKASLVNRIIYSDVAVQGEKTDAYQIFLPNNYYDVPQEYGDLTDVYVNQELFASTAQVQWRLFYNTLATQATSIGEIVLGTGGAFNRPGVPMTTVDGGFGGTSHWLHAINTVYGRVFVDRLQGKFFKMQENLAVFSGDLSSENKTYVQGLINSQILVGSEPLRERVLIMTGNTMWTYDMSADVFVSRNTYFPRWMFSHGPHLYSNNSNAGQGGTGIYKHSVGVTGVFYDKLHPSSITLVANAENTMSKLFKSVGIITKRTTEAGLNIPLSTFNTMQVWNMERNTGLLKVVPRTSSFQQPGVLQVLSNKVNDTFRILMSRDIVKDPSKSIFTPSNLAQQQGDTVLAKWLPKMRGTYIEIKLITDNTQGPLYVHDVLVEASQNIR